MTVVAPRTERRNLLAHPMSDYYIVLGATLLLLGIGLAMVLSASSVESIRIFDSAFTLARRQSIFAAIGIVAMIASARIPITWWRKLATLGIVLAIGFLVVVLIPGIGVEVAGQRNWIVIVDPFRFQPSEAAKFALILWGAHVISRRVESAGPWRRMLVPILPVSALIIILVALEGDFGNAVIIALISGALLFVAGVPMRIFAALTVVMVVGATVLTLMEPYRLERLTSWLNPSADRLGQGYQLTQGLYAFGTGGLWGVGLGASREKWGSLPEAHTDFIFPIVGEELGLIGTLSVLVLLAAICFAAFRICIRGRDQFCRIAAGGVGAWVIIQSTVNIGAVLGLLPITGVPLPLVSYGGSSLVWSLMALGLLLSIARKEAR